MDNYALSSIFYALLYTLFNVGEPSYNFVNYTYPSETANDFVAYHSRTTLHAFASFTSRLFL